jgi:hypothetical protein
MYNMCIMILGNGSHDQEIGLTAGVTGQQGMLTPDRQRTYVYEQNLN